MSRVEEEKNVELIFFFISARAFKGIERKVLRLSSSVSLISFLFIFMCLMLVIIILSVDADSKEKKLFSWKRKCIRNCLLRMWLMRSGDEWDVTTCSGHGENEHTLYYRFWKMSVQLLKKRKNSTCGGGKWWNFGRTRRTKWIMKFSLKR